MKRAILGVVLALAASSALSQSSYGTFRATVMTLPADASVPCPPTPMNSRSEITFLVLDPNIVYIGGVTSGDAGIGSANGYALLSDSGPQTFHSSYSSQTGAGQTWCYSVAGTIDGGLRILETR
jgi:hypothetical protein